MITIDHINPLDRLSPRELTAVRMLATDGATDREIGRALFLSEKTVKFHIAGARRKLGARNRTHLAVLAVAAGIFDEEEREAI